MKLQLTSFFQNSWCTYRFWLRNTPASTAWADRLAGPVSPKNSWISVPAIEDRYIVNVGDLLHRWTGGIYRSAVHRVINTGSEHRYSIPFFYNGNLRQKLSPLDGSDEGNAITVEDHVKGKLKASYEVKQ
jgi:isopenicillin N synthase-like dioxygenase